MNCKGPCLPHCYYKNIIIGIIIGLIIGLIIELIIKNKKEIYIKN